MKKTNLRIGLVARCDNSGLGTMSYDFYRHLPFSKVLAIPSNYENYYDRYPGAIMAQMGVPTLAEIDEFLKDLDLVITIETPYNWNIYSEARKRGIKTILIPMFEWMPFEKDIPAHPDLYLCPSTIDFDEIPHNKKFLQTPVDRVQFPYKERKQAKTFIFNNGHGGFMGRNGLQELMHAITMVKSDVKFKIRSQIPVEPSYDTRIEIQQGDFPHKEIWSEGDVYLHLHKFDGLSLPINEAMSCGYIVVAPNIRPMREYLPEKCLFDIDGWGKLKTIRTIDMAVLSPKKIAEKIDEIASMGEDELKELSHAVDKVAQDRSWENLYDQYIDTFEEVCKQ